VRRGAGAGRHSRGAEGNKSAVAVWGCSVEAAMIFWLLADAIGHSFGLVRAGGELALPIGLI
jgi:hypothetical protein